jgi:hypothetical protein
MGQQGAKAVRGKHHLGTEVGKLEQLFAAHGLPQA